ncbi:uncharacterized protein [Saccopteryx leptura]|uniref:uncharacterized protein n=1 Tax=Saccopteryx leptura TaxID=249018 RepID=UPI00339D02FE
MAALAHADKVHASNPQMPVGPEAVPDMDPNWNYQVEQTGWIEAFPTSRETADTVASILVENIIPRFGLPTTIQSDNGPAFNAQIVQQVATSLNITWKLHIPYHPQSLGKVERAHGILKGPELMLSVSGVWIYQPWTSLAGTLCKPLGVTTFDWPLATFLELQEIQNLWLPLLGPDAIVTICCTPRMAFIYSWPVFVASLFLM